MRFGVVIRVHGELAFVPAESALRVARLPEIARVAGAPEEILGIALFEGVILPVVSLADVMARDDGEVFVLGDDADREDARGDDTGHDAGRDGDRDGDHDDERAPFGVLPGVMLVCERHGERIGLVGATVLATGAFALADAGGRDVFYESERDGTRVRARPFDVEALYARLRGTRSVAPHAL